MAIQKKNRQCYCCGKGYNYCPNCYRYSDKDPSIYTLFDSKECKNIFNTLNDITFNKITISEAKEKLIAMGVKDSSKYKKVKDHLDSVLNYEDIKKSTEIKKNIPKDKGINNKRKNVDVNANSEVIND